MRPKFSALPLATVVLLLIAGTDQSHLLGAELTVSEGFVAVGAVDDLVWSKGYPEGSYRDVPVQLEWLFVSTKPVAFVYQVNIERPIGERYLAVYRATVTAFVARVAEEIPDQVRLFGTELPPDEGLERLIRKNIYPAIAAIPKAEYLSETEFRQELDRTMSERMAGLKLSQNLGRITDFFVDRIDRIKDRKLISIEDTGPSRLARERAQQKALAEARKREAKDSNSKAENLAPGSVDDG